MIPCHNCGFGHLTLEELKACKPWPETFREMTPEEARKADAAEMEQRHKDDSEVSPK